MRDLAGAVKRFRLEPVSAQARAALLRIDLDKSDVALLVQKIVVWTEAPTGYRMTLEAIAETLVEENRAGLIRTRADNADALFARDVRFRVHGRPF
jgi:hypothetical protein